MAKNLSDEFLQYRQPIVVSGTHGKTTTSMLMTYLLRQLGEEPGHFVGGVSLNFEKGYEIGKGSYFVVEGDEYDTACFDKVPKFLHYRPKYLIITSLEYDHADIYSSLGEIEQRFRELVRIIPEDGVIVANNHYKNLVQIIREENPKCDVYFYQSQEGWHLRNFHYRDHQSIFDIYRGDDLVFSEAKTTLLGQYNAENILSCFILAQHLGFDVEQVIRSFSGFKGVKRRQELIGIQNEIAVYDDFAHHPSAVLETLKDLNLKQNDKFKRLVCI